MKLHRLRGTISEEIIPCILEEHLPARRSSDQAESADLLNGPCPLDYRSGAHFDRHDEEELETVLCLLVNKFEKGEKMLMIAETGNSVHEYRRVGVATHFHETWGYMYCDQHECRADICSKKFSCKMPLRRFNSFDDCFWDIEEILITLI